ncbi:hypothetical protein [Mucilaginibacter psychrotolerans]|uniref:Uncharacterized protein n=1 Tax=Mucilaginibacter psychrotolerans TaxID=1524096 RepID=A0A4Y8SC00_9SPHI|nr:hypothetical protein [Mucilaginibacter psychrotolerans]TFF36171.1 hypothetical protein E2R66_16645 [Mucilaginibacter psychrotolerans]
MQELDHTDKNLIDNCFDGNAKKYKEALEEAHREAISWSDIALSAKTFPELKFSAQELIKDILGFLPADSIILPHEPFLRALLQSFRSDQISAIELLQQADIALKPIRNEVIKHHTGITNDRELYKTYFEYLPQQSEAAKARLTKFLGYEPKLEHSVYAEILLREVMAGDHIYIPEHPTGIDLQAIALIKYREVLLEKGKIAADMSPIVSFEILAEHSPAFQKLFEIKI